MTQRWLVILAVGTILLAACSGQNGGTTQPPDGVATQPGPPTPTGIPESPMPTFVPETLTTEQVLQRLDPFSAPECQLPCYNGLTPGDTGLSDGLKFYARLGVGISDFVPGDLQRAITGKGNLRATLVRSSDIGAALDGGFKPPEANVYMNESKVQKVYVRYETYAQSLDAPRVIATLGVPDQVGLSLLFTTDPNIPSDFIIQMVYTARQAGFSYLGSTAGDATAQQACLNGTAVRETVLGVFAAGFAPFSDNSPALRLLPIEQGGGLSTADFANMITTTGCISIPSDRWPQYKPQ